MQCGGMNIKQDAIYGMNREPDIHLLFSWIEHVETGVAYSHFDILVPTDENDCDTKGLMWIPSEVAFQEPMSKEFMYRIHDEQQMIEEGKEMELQRQSKCAAQQAAPPAEATQEQEHTAMEPLQHMQNPTAPAEATQEQETAQHEDEQQHASAPAEATQEPEKSQHEDEQQHASAPAEATQEPEKAQNEDEQQHASAPAEATQEPEKSQQEDEQQHASAPAEATQEPEKAQHEDEQQHAISTCRSHTRTEALSNRTIAASTRDSTSGG